MGAQFMAIWKFFLSYSKMIPIGVSKLFSERPSFSFAAAKWNGFCEKAETKCVDVQIEENILSGFQLIQDGLSSENHSIIFTFGVTYVENKKKLHQK